MKAFPCKNCLSLSQKTQNKYSQWGKGEVFCPLPPTLNQFLCNCSCDKETEVIPNIEKKKKKKYKSETTAGKERRMFS